MRSLAWLLWVALVSGMSAQAPDHWAVQFGGAGPDQVSDVQQGPSGDLFAIGDFSATMLVNGVGYGSAGQRDVFVSRLDPDGLVLWVVTAGGPGMDRGLKLMPTDDGDVMVTGQFMGQALLFDTLVNSAGGTPDVFVARLDGLTGERIWLRTAGSASAGDRPGGISVSGSGQVVVAGEFKGECWFDNTMLSSMIDPLTMEPGFDVFVASYGPGGDLLWVQQGAAPYTDRAVDVVSDELGNAYVVGQFSDTITFDIEHPNQMSNATFLLKLDPAGQEQWMIRAGGGLFNHARDLVQVADGTMLLCGEFQGSMNYLDDQPDVISSSNPWAYFILRIDPDGQLLSAASEGSEHPIRVGGICSIEDSLALVGSFDCGFTAMQDRYGEGTFIATGSEDLFVALHAADLSFLRAQQFGGVGAKRPGAIAWPSSGPVWCASFSEDMVFPADTAQWSGFASVTGPNDQLGTYCGDPYYGVFRGMQAVGQQDGYLASGFAMERSAYDPWVRGSGTPCQPVPLAPFLALQGEDQHMDTANVCWPPAPGGSSLLLEVRFPGAYSIPGQPHVLHPGFGLTFLWNTGETSDRITPTSTGWYWCTVSAMNGCDQWTDSIWVQVSSYPTVLLSDGVGFNVNAPFGQTVPMELCGQTSLIWISTLNNADSIQWYVNGIEMPGDTMVVDTSGLYTVIAYNGEGCSAINSITVISEQLVTLPALSDVQLTFYFLDGSVLDGDSVLACDQVGCILGTAGITWLSNGQPVSLPAGTAFQASTDLGCYTGSSVIALDSIFWSVAALSSGWVPFTVSLSVSDAPCGSTAYSFSVTDSLYIVTVPLPGFDPPPLDWTLCAGDTIELFLSNCSNCDSIAWNGPGLLTTFGTPDTAWVVTPGLYSYQAMSIADELSCSLQDFLFVLGPEPASIMMDPPDGIICPGDTALLSVDPGAVNVLWFGPDGPMSDTTATIGVTQIGDYEVIFTDSAGCEVGGGPVQVAYFGSPYLEPGASGSVLCQGGVVEIMVQAPAATAIQWDPPLSGNSPSQLVTQPGSYSCSVTSCGTMYSVAIEVLAGTAEAQVLTPGPFQLCPGDTVVLQALPGQAEYFWLPASVPSETLLTVEPGQMQLVVVDDLGCTDTSDVVLVEGYAFTVPLTANADTVCAGTDRTLVVPASGNIAWYGDPMGSMLVGTGPTLGLGLVDRDTVVYVTQQEGPCTSYPVPFMLQVVEPVDIDQVLGPTTLCEGEMSAFSVGLPDLIVQWITPFGTFVGDPLIIPEATTGNAGNYTVIAANGTCPADSAIFWVDVDPCDLVVPNVFSPNGDGLNDRFLVDGNGRDLQLVIMDRWGQVMARRQGGVVDWDGRQMSGEMVSEGTYFYLLEIQGTLSPPPVIRGHLLLLR